MKRLFLPVAVLVSVMSGCASVPMESTAVSSKAKKFEEPSPDMAGIYIYRKDTPVGAALKKDVWVDGKCIGETAKGVFFYHEVEGNKEHTISTESEFSPNDLTINTETGSLYFIEQYLKMGVFVGGAGLELNNIAEGKQEVSKLEMATQGNCSATKS
ncbi:DUF2846 domain-containing protein [Pseudoalteromonas sp. APC 3694]|jgi:hypothetical protein|uniref:DUF2846 domain-containing protein n=1 Tax=Pseudoalteromonas sp. APC 3694 TaxID=3035202 RepID=UPI0025B4C4CA|nr:DUF2846 domain-containing protein [Pseudoalteromonas sp. APC 3694]MDN3489500.1 DUF2846 domain-containing protein [Pseudoalteromonas sp. APC 3694]|tara:strand:- start:2583 stop:3053 length:471 start_codon:yes stop_codon:yes gene_type:complete